MTKEGFKKMQELLDQFTEDVSLSQMNLEEKSLEAPAYPAKWIGIHHTYRHELQEMQAEMGRLREREDALTRSKLKVDVTEAQMKNFKLKNNKEMKDLEIKIDDHREIIEMLSKLEKTVSFYRNDIKNAIDYARLLTA